MAYTMWYYTCVLNLSSMVQGEQACPFYMKTGTCKYALTCKFDHPPPGEAAAKAIADAGKPEQPEVGEVLPNY